MTKKLSPTTDVLFRIKRGLCGYVSYLAACEMNQAFSEYVLYEPILRILTARNYIVECEYECPGIPQPKRGDKKRLDFFATQDSITLAIEVKWVKANKTNYQTDIDKLFAILKKQPKSKPLMCIFGRKSDISEINFPSIDGAKFIERGSAVYADFRKTRYGCRIFQLKEL